MNGGEIDWTSLNNTLDETEIEPTEDDDEHRNSDLSPAVSLTSLNISRRRPKGRARFEKTAYLPIGNVDGTDLQPLARIEAPAPPKPETTAESPAAAQSPPVAPKAPPVAASERRHQEIPANLFNYWKDLRGSRRYASLADFDQTLITSQWPSSILLKFAAGSQRPQIVKLSGPDQRAGAPSTPKQDMAIDYTPLMSEWILDLGRRLVEAGVPIHETETFPTKHGDVRYRVLVLPLSDDQNRVDHALYHIAHA